MEIKHSLTLSQSVHLFVTNITAKMLWLPITLLLCRFRKFTGHRCVHCITTGTFYFEYCNNLFSTPEMCANDCRPKQIRCLMMVQRIRSPEASQFEISRQHFF